MRKLTRKIWKNTYVKGNGAREFKGIQGKSLKNIAPFLIYVGVYARFTQGLRKVN